MTINDAKKVMLDKVNLEIEAAEIRDEIQVKEKQIKKLTYWADEMQMQYDDLANSGMRMFFLGLIGKKEARLQEAQNEVRRTKGELSSAEFDLESLKARVEDIEQTTKEITGVCNECLLLIAEIDGVEIKNRILTISELPRLRAEISRCLTQAKPLFTAAYDFYQTRTVAHSRPGMEGVYNSIDSNMRKQSKLIENAINEIIQLLNKYNEYASEEIKIEFHAKWMDKENYWEEQQMAYDTMERIKKVEDWFYRLDNCWKVMGKQQKETIRKLQEEVLAYLDE